MSELTHNERKLISWFMSESQRVEGVVCVEIETLPEEIFSTPDIEWIENEKWDIMEMGCEAYRAARGLSFPKP